MKKILSILFSLVLMVGLFAGCKSEEDSNKKTDDYSGKPEQKYLDAGKEIPYKDLDLDGREIVIAAWWDPKPGDKGSSAFADAQWERIEYLEKQYNCKFKFKAMLQDEMIGLIQTSVESNAPVFDVGFVLTSQVPTLAANNYLQAIDDLTSFKLDEAKWSDFALSVGVINNKKYTFSLEEKYYPRQVLLWNKTMFQKNNWGDLNALVDNNEWTFEKMQEIAIKATDASVDRTGLLGYADLLQSQIILSNDAELISFDADGTPKFAADSKNALEAIQYLIDLRQKYNAMDEPEGATWDYYTKAFANRKAAMIATEVYAIGWQEIKDMEDDFGLVPLPMGPQATTYSSRVGNSPIMIMLANNSKAQEVAYILDLYSEPYPGLEDTWKVQFEALLRDDYSVNMVGKIADSYCEFDRSFFFEGARTMIIDAINLAWVNEKTPAEALSEIKTQAQKSIDDTYASWKK